MNTKNRITGLIALFIISLNTFQSCSFFNSIGEEPSETAGNGEGISCLSLGKNALTTSAGSMEYVSVTVKPSSMQKDARLKWTYDSSVIECDTSSSWGVTVKALREGQTALRCSCGGYDASCLITVSGTAEGYETATEPYIYSNYSIIQTAPGVSEKVFVSLYGGDAGDIDGYTWSADNNSVIGIQPTGQYCVITAKGTGYARIKVTHSKAAYPYYIGVYVFADNTETCYITTTDNIVTMNQEDGEKSISVSLVNGKDTCRDSDFKWEIITEGNSPVPVRLSWNGSSAVLSPEEGGSCTIRVTHPDASYPLDILCRVITVVKNVYIQPDNTVVTISGNEEITVTSELVNISPGEYDIDGFRYVLDGSGAAAISASAGNQVMLKGLANGSSKLIISHERSEYSREVLVIVNGQLSDAADASCYITTSQNYIRTKEGGEAQEISISLRGGTDGDEAGFAWSVKSSALDGSSAEVIRLETADGTVSAATRSAALTYASGTAVIEPLKEGTAVISISHPKVVYPTEILVKVLSRDAVLEEPLYFTGSGIVKILNGETAAYSVQLKGSSKKAGDENGITWKWDESVLSVSPSGNEAVITAPQKGTGCTQSMIGISHPKADSGKTVLVMTADDEESLKSMKALYADKTYYSLEAGERAPVAVSHAGFDSYDEATDTKTAYDFSGLRWTVKDPSVISAERNALNPLQCTVRALKAGQTTLTASIDSCSCEFSILVYPAGAAACDPEVYFTTSQNVLYLEGSGKSSRVSVSAVNLPSSEYSGITWKAEDEGICSVIPNGTSATVTALKEGETVITVSHPDSQNELKIYVRTGSEYVIKEAEPVAYISSDDVMTFLKDGQARTLEAVLVNGKEGDRNGFTFEIDDESVAKITAQTETGIACIKPVNSGQAEVTIRNKATSISKQVLVVVGNSEEELAGFTYLTTTSNVITIGEGNTKSISVSVRNSTSPVLDGYSWTSGSPETVDVSASGSSAILKANSTGTALITVTNRECRYPLTIIAQVVDPAAAAANPYIQLSSSVLTLTRGNAYTTVTADLVGGTQEDFSSFAWSVNDSSVCAVYGQNETGKLRALKAGQAYVTVTHPKAAYPAQILAVCEEEAETDCYISVPSSIISMKPTDSSQTITASLINGSSTDKYSFTWSLDVYDVIDFQYSANVCTITPKQSGSATITIRHPKAAYDQQVIVNVQEYTEFSFPQNSITVTQGNVSFLDMQIPNTSVTTHVEYSSDNAQVCTVSGTKAVAQLTGVSAGTATVRAKLVASGTGVTQAESEMLVYVREAETNAVYITSGNTICTLAKGKSQTLSAALSGSGVTNSDQYNLSWTTADSDIIQLTGITSSGTVRGQSIYITALKAGEALITCSHEKASSTLQFYVVVPGTGQKNVTLNKSYITMIKGSGGVQLKATIENSDGSADYNNLMWTCTGTDGNETARIMGSGQTVTVYPLNPGEATVMCQHPESEAAARCTVIVEAGKSLTFETTSRKVQPFHSRTLSYKVSPPSALLTWTTSQDDDYFAYRDLGCDSEGNGEVEITGMKEGSGTLACVTDGNAKAQCTVRVAWDYEFSVSGSTAFTCKPGESRTYEYSVSPSGAEVTAESVDLGTLFTCDIKDEGNGKGTVKITALAESPETVSVKLTARNPGNGYETVGTKTISAKFAYASLTPVISVTSGTGNYSSWNEEADVITLGDGESLTVSFGILEGNSSGYVESVTFRPNAGYGKPASLELVSDTEKGKIYTISDTGGDKVSYEYYIEKAYVPYYDGGPILDWKEDMVWWEAHCYHSGSSCSKWFGLGSRSHSNPERCIRQYGDYTDMQPTMYALANCRLLSGGTYATHSYNGATGIAWEYGSHFTKVEDPSLRGTVMSTEEFEGIAWFYCCGTRPSCAAGCSSDWTAECSMDNEYRQFGCDGQELGIRDFIMSENVTAAKRISTDRSVKKVEGIGSLTVKIRHLNSYETVTIPVQLETRNCSADY